MATFASSMVAIRPASAAESFPVLPVATRSTTSAAAATRHAPIPRADQRMRVSRGHGWLGCSHARGQDIRLTAKKLEHLALETAFAERHALQMHDIDRLLGRSDRRRRCLFDDVRGQRNHDVSAVPHGRIMVEQSRKAGKWPIGLRSDH
jgi:hypothetical protein